jgi:hypothetical protein
MIVFSQMIFPGFSPVMGPPSGGSVILGYRFSSDSTARFAVRNVGRSPESRQGLTAPV